MPDTRRSSSKKNMPTATAAKRPGKLKTPVLSAAGSMKRGTDIGGGRSLERILAGTLAALSRRGASQLSMIDVCESAGVSRATLYRYFSRKEDLLEAIGEYVSQNFIAGIQAVAAESPEPVARVRAVLDFIIRYTAQVRADRILEIEPGFVINFLQANFVQHVAVLNQALSPVYDDIESHTGLKVNRLFISELLMRGQESTSLIPGGASWASLPDALADMLGQLYRISASRAKPSRR